MKGQRVVGEPVEAAQREPPAGLGLDHAEPGHRVARPPGELTGAARWVAAQDPRGDSIVLMLRP
jgi:hypothetical protein